MLQSLIERGADPEALKKMMDLADRWKAREAEAAFGQALSRFQAECPMIARTNEAKMANASYKYASMDDIMEEVGPVLARCGISVTFSTPKMEKEGWFQTVVHLQVGSHSVERPFCAPCGDLAATLKEMAARMKSINSVQAYGLWLSYQKRYALCAALGITVTDEDTDGRLPEPVSEEHAAILKGLYEKLATDDANKFLAWMTERCKMAVNSVEQVRECDYELARDALARKINARAKQTETPKATEAETKP
jgi:hypothetical protein